MRSICVYCGSSPGRREEYAVAARALGSALARTTHRAIVDAARAIFDDGDFSRLGNGISGTDIDAMLTAFD